MAAATKRVWETAFLLTAAMGQDFDRTFTEAQQQIADTYAQLRESEPVADQTSRAFEAAAYAITASGILDLLGKVKDGYLACITAASDFGYAMSGVEAVAGASSSEMQMLADEAKELGAETIYTAQESAAAMQYMAQAGWDASDILSGMDGVLAAAAASGEDFAAVSSIVADTLAGFQMEASESARVADVLAQAAAKTNTDILTMGETFKNSAALAGALGYSIEDVSAAVGLMANVGVKGSVAGTALKNIFNGLTSSITLSGVNLGEVEYSAVNPDGSMKAFSEVISDLRGYFSQMSEVEKFTNAQNIAGLRGYNGLIAILEATDEQYAELYQEISSCTGAAQEMADVRLDNLKGDVEIFKSAVEGLKIEIGEDLNPDLRDTVQLGTDIVGWMREFVEEHPHAVEAITLITTTLSSGLAALSGAAAIKAVIAALGGLGAILNPAVLAVGAGAAIIGGTIAGIVLLQPEVHELTEETEKLIAAHEALNEEYGVTVGRLDEQYDGYYSLVGQIENLADKENKSAAEKRLLLDLIDELNEAVPGLNLAYDAQSDSLNMASESMDEYIRKMYAMARAEEEIARARELLAQNTEYNEQLKEIDRELRSLYDQEAEYQAQIKEEGFTLANWKLGLDLADVQGDIKELEASKADLQAKYAQGVWEYDQAVRSAEGYYSAESSEAASAVEAVDSSYSSSGEYVTNITVNVPGDVSDDTVGKIGAVVKEEVEKAMERFELTRANKFRTAYVR